MCIQNICSYARTFIKLCTVVNVVVIVHHMMSPDRQIFFYEGEHQYFNMFQYV
jgi:hypothetical protein